MPLIASKLSGFEYLFDFSFWLSFYDVGWQLNEVWSMLQGFFIWSEEGCVECAVNFPFQWEF